MSCTIFKSISSIRESSRGLKLLPEDELELLQPVAWLVVERNE
jgi:hypothetical protein